MTENRKRAEIIWRGGASDMPRRIENALDEAEQRGAKRERGKLDIAHDSLIAAAIEMERAKAKSELRRLRKEVAALGRSVADALGVICDDEIACGKPTEPA